MIDRLTSDDARLRSETGSAPRGGALHGTGPGAPTGDLPEPPLWDSPPVDRQDFATRLRETGLTEHAPALEALVRDSVCLTPVSDQSEDGDAPSAPARLHLGGLPRLNSPQDWPRRTDGRPLSLVAQLDIQALHEALPDAHFSLGDGSLAFFYDALEQLADGCDPAEQDAWAVVLAGPGAAACPAPDDLDPRGVFRSLPLTTARQETFPAPGSYDVERTVGHPWSPQYERIFGEGDIDAVSHRFLGHPDFVQSDMQMLCQLASHGIDVSNPRAYLSPAAAPLRDGAEEWRLLLQVDSEEAIGMIWEDLGRLYWWMRESDLEAGNWDAGWFAFQRY